MTVSVPDLEQRFDAELLRKTADGPSAALRHAAEQWSEAVWTAAQAAGPLVLAPSEIERGLDLARHPIYIGGVHRSGTTLVRDLLDGHPSLAVLPSEGTFFTNLARALCDRPPGQHLPYAAQEWLRRLANPINQPPYWTLGRTADSPSPYVEFARSLTTWWGLAEQRLGPATTSWPLIAIALAYAHCTNGLSTASPLRRWAEKTPTSERFLHRLLAESPCAKFIHVIRHPFAVYASRKVAEQRGSEWLRNARGVLRDLELSYRIAVEQSQRPADDRYLLVRYEDLIANTERTMTRVADFLGIDALPILLRPTVAGTPATSNSSYGTAAPASDVISRNFKPALARITAVELDFLVALVANSTARLGYRLEPTRPWRARLLRLTTRLARDDAGVGS